MKISNLKQYISKNDCIKVALDKMNTYYVPARFYKKKYKLNTPVPIYHLAHSQLFITFLQSIYFYCNELLRIKHKYQILQKQMKNNSHVQAQVLKSQHIKINNRLKTIVIITYQSFNYSIILLKNSQISNRTKDQSFFQNLIELILILLIDNKLFYRENHDFIKQQINRLFRSNFKHEIPKNPIKANKKKQTMQEMIARLQKQSKIAYNPKSRKVQKSIIIFDKKIRSPIMESMLPSRKQKLKQLNKQFQRRFSLKQSRHLGNTF